MKKVSVFVRIRCPLSAGTTVRFSQDLVSEIAGICSTLIAQLLLTVIQKIAQTKKAFSVVATLVRMHLISMLDVCELLRSKNRSYKIVRGSPDGTLQLALFANDMRGGQFKK